MLGRISRPPQAPTPGPAKEYLFVGLPTGVTMVDTGCLWEASPIAAGLNGQGFFIGEVPAKSPDSATPTEHAWASSTCVESPLAGAARGGESMLAEDGSPLA